MLVRHSIEEIDEYSGFIFLAKTARAIDLIPKISTHYLRHIACSNLAMQGMKIKVLKYIMGHAHSDVTLDVYSHITSLSDVQAEIEKYDRVVCN